MGYTKYLTEFQDVSVSYTILAGTDYTTANVKITGKASWTIYIQRILVAVTTDNAATQNFQDSSSTPIEIAGTKASPGIGPIEFDFGPRGFACTADKSFQHKMSGAGLAASVTVQAYMKRTEGAAKSQADAAAA
jgi:hypothetical protein